MELSFTSPGWIKEDVLRKLKLDIPTCGACLSNMAIAPDGNVVPCKFWVEEMEWRRKWLRWTKMFSLTKRF